MGTLRSNLPLIASARRAQLRSKFLCYDPQNTGTVAPYMIHGILTSAGLEVDSGKIDAFKKNGRFEWEAFCKDLENELDTFVYKTPDYAASPMSPRRLPALQEPSDSPRRMVVTHKNFAIPGPPKEPTTGLDGSILMPPEKQRPASSMSIPGMSPRSMSPRQRALAAADAQLTRGSRTNPSVSTSFADARTRRIRAMSFKIDTDLTEPPPASELERTAFYRPAPSHARAPLPPLPVHSVPTQRPALSHTAAPCVLHQAREIARCSRTTRRRPSSPRPSARVMSPMAHRDPPDRADGPRRRSPPATPPATPPRSRPGRAMDRTRRPAGRARRRRRPTWP